MIGGGFEEFGQYLFVILDFQFALLNLFFGPFDILLFTAEPTLESADFFMELTLGDKAFLSSAAHLVQLLHIECDFPFTLFVQG
jgi:hypothetical protein